MRRREEHYQQTKETSLATNKTYRDLKRDLINAKNLERYKLNRDIRNTTSTLSNSTTHAQL